MYQTIEDGRFGGERALYRARNLKLVRAVFNEGESPLKEGENLCLEDVQFRWKYPLWRCRNVTVSNSTWLEMARSGVWYTDDIRISSCLIEAPKNFRRCWRLILEDTDLVNAQETLWNCQDIQARNITVRGDYFGMNAERGTFSNMRLSGNYAFDGASDLLITDSVILSKDAFWNTRNVEIRNSHITGEYLGWHSENLKLVNCTISSGQGLCYAKHLTLENCRLLDTDLAFEYSSVTADISGTVDSIKNPDSGSIEADSVGQLILDEQIINPDQIRIIERQHPAISNDSQCTEVK